MRSLYTIIILAFLFILTTPLQAQPGPGRGERQLQEMKTKLSLTDDQYKQVDSLMQKQREEMRAIFDAGSDDREQMRASMMKVNEKYDKEIQKILTKEQLPKFDEYQKERRERMQQRMRDRG